MGEAGVVVFGGEGSGGVEAGLIGGVADVERGGDLGQCFVVPCEPASRFLRCHRRPVPAKSSGVFDAGATGNGTAVSGSCTLAAVTAATSGRPRTVLSQVLG